MSVCDEKPGLESQTDIEVVEVTEILDDDQQDCEAAAELLAETQDSRLATKKMRSKGEVLRILNDAAATFIARPVGDRAYAKRKALKKWVGACVTEKLRPMRPTKVCKKYLHIRLPYRSPVISLHVTSAKHLLKKPKPVKHRRELDTRALPLSLDDYVSQMERIIPQFIRSDGPRDSKTDEEGLDVTDIKTYKMQLLSGINLRFLDAVAMAKSSEELQCTVSRSDRMRYLVTLRDMSVEQQPFRCGLKVLVTVAGQDFMGDVIGVLSYDDVVDLTLIMREAWAAGHAWRDASATIRSLGLVGHLTLQAKALLTLEKYDLHVEFLNPVMTSIVSGISIEFSDGFRNRYPDSLFYMDSVQKVIDTVALHQPDVSSVCVVEDFSSDNMASIFCDCVRYLLRKEEDIVECLREVVEVGSDDASDPTRSSLNMIIVSKSSEVLQDVRTCIAGDVSCYHPRVKTEDIFNFLKSLSRKPYAKPEYQQLVQAIQEGDPRAYESAKKRGRDCLLEHCSALVGTIDDLLNDESVVRLLDSKVRTFDVALVHDATTFSDAELLSLLLFGIRKLVCFTLTAKEAGNTIADRMISKARGDILDSRSPVLDRSVYQSLQDKRRREKEERKACYSRSHSMANRPKERPVDPLTRQCNQEQSQRVYASLRGPPARGGTSFRGDYRRGSHASFQSRGTSRPPHQPPLQQQQWQRRF